MKAIRILLLPVLLLASARPAGAQARQYNYKMDGPFTATETIAVNGECFLCKYRIERAAMNITGVWYADWDISSKSLLVKYHCAKLHKGKIEEAVMAAGHDTQNYRANDSAYKALPLCCHYLRKMESAGQ